MGYRQWTVSATIYFNIKAINLLGVNKCAHEIKILYLCFFSS